jgi:hypothetical protein
MGEREEIIGGFGQSGIQVQIRLAQEDSACMGSARSDEVLSVAAPQKNDPPPATGTSRPDLLFSEKAFNYCHCLRERSDSSRILILALV